MDDGRLQQLNAAMIEEALTLFEAPVTPLRSLFRRSYLAETVAAGRQARRRTDEFLASAAAIDVETAEVELGSLHKRRMAYERYRELWDNWARGVSTPASG
ncbi:MAG: hypothetical protein M3459_06325 [Actinomycetota bacterium]|nr:hypothetical protein [Actinomycetota bacterium]